MAFLVEDGTGEVVGANSYASVLEFKTYWDDRGFDYTIFAPDAQVERALVRATDFIELKYRLQFKGRRLVLSPLQPLSFPRYGLYAYCTPVEGIPDALKAATHEYAKRALTGELVPDPGGFDATGQVIEATKVKVGPIEKEQRYQAGSGAILRDYPAADNLLTEYLYTPGGVIRA